MLNNVPMMSAIGSWPRNKSGSPQAGSVVLDVFRLSCSARMASASDLKEIPINFRYGLVSAASKYSVFWHHRTQPSRTESDSI